MKKNSINGKVPVANSIREVLAIKGTDTVKAEPVRKEFELKVTPGTWKILIATNKPYKNTCIEKVLVSEGNDIDLGEIALEQ